MTLKPASEPKRIAIVGTLAETLVGFRSELIKDLVAKGHEVFAIASQYTEALKERIQALGATPIEYSISQFGMNPLREWRSIWQLYRLFKKLKPDIVLSYFTKPSIYGTVAAHLARVPKVVAKIEGLGRVFTDNCDSGASNSWRKRAARILMLQLFRWSLPKADVVLFLNQDDEHDLKVKYNIKLKQSAVIGGIGVCLEHYAVSPTPIEPFRFIFVGRLLNEKGIREYLAAAEQIKTEHPNVEFWVLGQPDQNKHALRPHELAAYVNRGIVHYPGKVADVALYLQQSSVFVLPSYYREGVPRSTQEALAVGRAVITTNMPGCKDTVNHEVNGLLIPPRNVEALKNAMCSLIQSPERAIKMGAQSAKLAKEKFNVRSINQRIESLIL